MHHIILLLVTSVLAAQAQQLQCHIAGQCSGIVVGAGITDSYNSCLDLCKDNTNCNWITHLADTNDCIELYDCPEVETSCTNCYSSQVDCPHEEPTCNQIGFCNGHFIAANHTSNVDDCLKDCQAVKDCKWYSYFPDSGQCLLTEDCLFVDDSCTNCLYGERECQLDTGILGHKLFVVGGEFAPAEYTAEVVDLSGEDLVCPNMVDYPGGPYGLSGIYIDDQALVCGGGASTCFNYDPQKNTWNRTSSMLRYRDGAADVLLTPTSWWVTGDHYSNGLSTELYDSTTDSFSLYVNLPVSKGHHNLVKINSTHIMLFGTADYSSNKTWMFNTETETWSSLPDMPVANRYMQGGMVTYPDGRKEVMAVAGFVSAATQIFSLDTMTWRLGSDFAKGSLASGASVPYGQSFLIVGGEIQGVYQDTIYLFNVDTEEWDELPQKLKIGRYINEAFLVPDDFIVCS